MDLLIFSRLIQRKVLLLNIHSQNGSSSAIAYHLLSCFGQAKKILHSDRVLHTSKSNVKDLVYLQGPVNCHVHNYVVLKQKDKA